MKRMLHLTIWLAFLPALGCSSMTGPRALFDRSNPDFVEEEEIAPERREQGLLGGFGKNVRKSTGLYKADKQGSIKLYNEGIQVFQAAAALERTDPNRRKQFKAAASKFTKAAKKWEDSALEQDAQFMAAESLFFADELNDAEELYSLLMKNHPRNRHVDRIEARKFQIARYWVDVGTVKKYSFIRPNLFNDSLPWTDVRGHGIKVYDQMRFDDPTGRLADDATMAGAVDLFEQGRYEEADQWFSDLIQTFPDSQHQFKAHLLAIRSKLSMYRGPSYSEDPVLEAKKLVDRMTRAFRSQLETDPEMAKTVAEASAEIKLRLAERLLHDADYYQKRGEYGPARWCYQQCAQRFGDTPLAEQAEQGLAKTEGQPELPPQRLAWIADMFPNSKPQQPLLRDSNSENLRR